MGRETEFDWDAFVDGAARAFWVSAYMRGVDELPGGQRKALSPGGGGDWMDVAPETPRKADREALKFSREFSKKVSNKVIIQMMDAYGDAELAGHNAAMESMGHGVGLFNEGIKGPTIRMGEGIEDDLYNEVDKAIRKELKDLNLYEM